jgi:acetylornithine deacetylase/succinyl-diaminopimelate desuccinylase-like protein
MENSESLINVLSKLTAFPTITADRLPNDNCLDYVSNVLRNFGLKVVIEESNSYKSLYASTASSKTPVILLQAHLDVVPAHSESFEMLEKDGKLYGRGVYDMKFAAACYLQLVEDLKDELGNYNFGIMFTTDEEVGGVDGVGMLLDKGYGAAVCILPDGGNNWELETSCNGIWFVRLIAKGQSAHGSRPWEGENAINILLSTLEDIQRLFSLKKPSECTLTISQIHGGKAVNQVPDYAEAVLDMRFADTECYEEKRKEIEEIIIAHKLDHETISQVDCGHVDVNNPYIADFMRIAERCSGRSIGETHSFGSSDARFFAQHNIPTILMRPAGGGHHGENEWIDKAELLNFYEVLKAYVIETAKID